MYSSQVGEEDVVSTSVVVGEDVSEVFIGVAVVAGADVVVVGRGPQHCSENYKLSNFNTKLHMSDGNTCIRSKYRNNFSNIIPSFTFKSKRNINDVPGYSMYLYPYN